MASADVDAGLGVRAVILAPTRELAHQIHNECLKLAQGRKWRVVLFSKATANTLSDKAARDKVGAYSHTLAWNVNLLTCFRYNCQYAAASGRFITVRIVITEQVSAIQRLFNLDLINAFVAFDT